MEKLQKEKRIVQLMIELYCRKKHRGKRICAECGELLSYAHLRVERCPFKEEKPFCSSCTVHCYKPAMKEKIRDVMRFSGPRMMLYHPIVAIKHLLQKGRKS